MALFTRSKTFESITAGLQKTVTDLTKYAEEQRVSAENARAESARLLSESFTADDEVSKALAAKDKIAALLG